MCSRNFLPNFLLGQQNSGTQRSRRELDNEAMRHKQMASFAEENGLDGDEESFFGNLFLNEHYVPFYFYFGAPEIEEEGESSSSSNRDPVLTETLLAGKQACTDWDLTGQIVWPAAFQLAYFMHNPKYTDAFRGKRVVELGSGAGLSGFVAAKYASKVVLTDGNEIVMRLLDKNIDFVKMASPSSCPVAARRLYWGEETSVRELVEAHGVPDVLCGADIIMWPNYTLTLMQTIAFFFSHNTNMECYVSYVVRAHSTTKLMHSCAAECGMRIDVIDPMEFLPPNDWQPQGLLDVEQKYMLKISLL